MSRIGLKAIEIPEGVSLTLEKGFADVKGPKGSLQVRIPACIEVKIEGGRALCRRINETKEAKQLHGTTRANLNDAVVGVSKGFRKDLVIVGIGYRAEKRGDDVAMFVGYSHPVIVSPRKDSSITVKSNTEVIVEGISKQAVGQTAALIRGTREPEPYNGKGVMYKGERIIRKEGKRAVTTGNA